jgi:hypothetical protein
MEDNQPETHLAEVPEGLPAKARQAESRSNEAAGSNGKQNQDQASDAVAQPSDAVISPQKLAANRRNAQRSTGPKTAAGKAISSWNSLQHGLLSKRLVESSDQKKEQFSQFLASAQQDLEPVGALEQLLVEKIAHEYWRLGIAARCETQEFTKSSPFEYTPYANTSIDRILRYQTTINRQLFQAISQLERLQRLRKGDNVPAPVNVQVSHDSPAILEE